MADQKPPTAHFSAINSNKKPAAFTVLFVQGFELHLRRRPRRSRTAAGSARRAWGKGNEQPAWNSFLCLLVSSQAAPCRWKRRLAATASCHRYLLFPPALPGRIPSPDGLEFVPVADSPVGLVLPRFIPAICRKICSLFPQPVLWVCQIHVKDAGLLFMVLTGMWDIKIQLKQVP